MKVLLGLLVCAASSWMATPMLAQVCVGTPVSDGQRMFGGRVLFPDGGTVFGPTGTFNVNGPASVEWNVDLFDSDIEGADMGFGVGVRLPYELRNLAIPICPVVGASYATIEDLDAIGIEVGAALGADLALTSTSSLLLYGLPELVISRFSVGDASETESDFVLELGGTVAAQRLHGTLLILLGDDTVFGVRVGITH